jgi:hypothetical protein
MQNVLGILWIVLIVVLGILALVGFRKSQLAFDLIKEKVPSVFNNGEAARWNNPSDALSFWGYILGKKYLELNDPILEKKCSYLWFLFIIYTILFLGIIVVQILIGVYK